MPGLLVADDEAIVRSALAQTIAHGAPDLGPIGEAASGEEAISLARQMRPDMVLMDVKMPGINGLEAMRTIRAENPAVKVIVLTAYDEFSFSQEALRLGAIDYLLKPVRPGVLLNVLNRLKTQIEQEQQSQLVTEQATLRLRDTLPLVEAQCVSDLIHGSAASRSPVDRVLGHLEKTISSPAVLVVDVDHFGQATKAMDQERLGRFSGLLTDIVRRVVGDAEHCLIGHIRPGVLVAIVSTGRGLASTKDIRGLGHAIRYAVESSAPVTVTVGIGGSVPDLEHVRASYAEAVRAQWFRSYFGINSVIHIDDVRELISTRRPYPVELERELMGRVRLGERQASELLMGRVVDHLLEQPDELPETISTRAMELIALLSRAVIDAGAPMAEVLDISHRQVVELGQPKSGDDVRSWAMKSLAALMANIPTGDNGDRLIERAVAHMRLQLANPELQLKDVARSVNLSPSHLAHLFKARTGSSYLKYLTDLRMAEARKLLATTDLTIAAVGILVGYENSAYFHRVFRREVSMTPSTYRQMARVA